MRVDQTILYRFWMLCGIAVGLLVAGTTCTASAPDDLQISATLAKVHRDLLAIDRRICWNHTNCAGSILLADSVPVTGWSSVEGQRLRQHLFQWPKPIPADDYDGYNARLAEFLSGRDMAECCLLRGFRNALRIDRGTSSVEEMVREFAHDPFNSGRLYGYYGFGGYGLYGSDAPPWNAYILQSAGPDHDIDVDLTMLDQRKSNMGRPRPLVESKYDPTNGLVSDGDIFLVFEDRPFPGPEDPLGPLLPEGTPEYLEAVRNRRD